MSGEWNAQRAREMLAGSSPTAARAMRARMLEQQRAQRERQTSEPWRWEVIDELARRAIEAQPRLVEAFPPVEGPQVVDEEAERRRVSLALARMRARTERGNRQNDKSKSTS